MTMRDDDMMMTMRDTKHDDNAQRQRTTMTSDDEQQRMTTTMTAKCSKKLLLQSPKNHIGLIGYVTQGNGCQWLSSQD